MNCPDCNCEIEGTNCLNCNRPSELPRIDGRYLRQEIGSILNLEKGIFLTIRELFLRPGQNIRMFLLEDRNRLVKPIIFIIICSLVYSVAQQLLQFEDGYIKYSPEQQNWPLLIIFEWIQSHYGYANILISFFVALWTRLLFHKSGYNFFEILVVIFFVIGIGMLIYSVFGIIEAITSLKVLHIGGFFGIIYASWAIGQFFDRKKFGPYLMALLAYFLGILTFVFSAFALGITIEFILNT